MGASHASHTCIQFTQVLQDKKTPNSPSLRDLVAHNDGYSLCCGSSSPAVAIWRPRTGEVFRVETDHHKNGPVGDLGVKMGRVRDDSHDGVHVHDGRDDAGRAHAHTQEAKQASVTIEVWGAFLNDGTRAYVSVWQAPRILSSMDVTTQMLTDAKRRRTPATDEEDDDGNKTFAGIDPISKVQDEPVLFVSVPVTYPGRITLRGLPAGYTYHAKLSIGYALNEGSQPWESSDSVHADEGVHANEGAAGSLRGSYGVVNFTVVDTTQTQTQTQTPSDRHDVWLHVGGSGFLPTSTVSYSDENIQDTVMHIPGSNLSVLIKWQSANCQRICRYRGDLLYVRMCLVL
jgi:hypothetical protein